MPRLCTPSTSLADETCQFKDTWMQQPVHHFLLLLSCQGRREWRSKYRCSVNCNSGGPLSFYLLWQPLLLSKSNTRAWARKKKKASNAFNKVPGKAQGKKKQEALSSAVHWPGLATQRLQLREVLKQKWGECSFWRLWALCSSRRLRHPASLHLPRTVWANRSAGNVGHSRWYAHGDEDEGKKRWGCPLCTCSPALL